VDEQLAEPSEFAKLRWNGAGKLIVGEFPENAAMKKCEHTIGDKKRK